MLVLLPVLFSFCDRDRNKTLFLSLMEPNASEFGLLSHVFGNQWPSFLILHLKSFRSYFFAVFVLVERGYELFSSTVLRLNLLHLKGK